MAFQSIILKEPPRDRDEQLSGSLECPMARACWGCARHVFLGVGREEGVMLICYMEILYGLYALIPAFFYSL